MFKKLKDKIAEEVKISPQRIQQFTQSVTDKLQSNGNDENVFSITEDDSLRSPPSEPEPGFTNVSLHSTTSSSLVEPRFRRNSNSSLASDGSFLPRYEPSISTYHLQSDLDISASEVEDNASTSSQMGHISKEQVYSAFQKAQMRYHKYRGRYTDLANHYKELERENSKMRAVLVETQDKAIRRASELREQCVLSQKAKADLEHALHTELEEKQIIIHTLKDKVDLLQQAEKSNVAKLVEADTLEINSLKEKLQQMKANTIVLQSKESEAREKIINLEKMVGEQKHEIAAFEEREKSTNLKFARSKMELHTELQNRDLEIVNLKKDLETVKHDLEALESKQGAGLKSQNAKLIEKCETLSDKCKHYEAEILKVEQYKSQLAELQKERSDLEVSKDEDLQILIGEEVKKAIYEKEMIIFKLKEAADDNEQKVSELKQTIEEKFKEVTELKETIERNEKYIAEFKNFKDEKDIEIVELNRLVEMKEKLITELNEGIEMKEKHISELLKKVEELETQNEILSTDLREMNNNFKEIEKGNDNLLKSLQDKEGQEEELLLLRPKVHEDALTIESLTQTIKALEETHAENTEKLLNNTKQSLLSLETRIRSKIEEDYNVKEKLLKEDFDLKLKLLEESSEDSKETQIQLMQSRGEVKDFTEKLENTTEELRKLSEAYTNLETNHLGLIDENNGHELEILKLHKEIDALKIKERDMNKKLENDFFTVKQENENVNKELSKVSSEKLDLMNTLQKRSDDVNRLETERKNMLEELEKLKVSNIDITAKLEELQSTVDIQYTELSDKNEEHNKLIKKYDQLLKEVETATQANIELQSNIEDLKNLKLKNDDYNKLHQEFVDITNKFKKCSELLNETKREQEHTLERLEFKESEIGIKDETILNLQGKCSCFHNDNSKLNLEITELKSEISHLQVEHRELQDKLHKISEQSEEFEKIKKEVKNNKDKDDQEIHRLQETIRQLELNNSSVNSIEIKCKELQEIIEKNQDEIKRLLKIEETYKQVLVDYEAINKELHHLKTNNEEITRELENLRKIDLKYNSVLNENIDLKEIETRYKSILDENHNLKEENSQLEKLHQKISILNNELELKANEVIQTLEINQKLNNELAGLKIDLVNFDMAKEVNLKLESEVSRLQLISNTLNAEKQELLDSYEKLKIAQSNYKDALSSNEDFEAKIIMLEEEIDKLSGRNSEISRDNQILMKENDDILAELMELKTRFEEYNTLNTKLDTLESENKNLKERINELNEQNGSLREKITKLLSNLDPTLEAEDLHKKVSEYNHKYEQLLTESDIIKKELTNYRSQTEIFTSDRKKLETQVSDLERHCSELLHERQLLREEIEELKISPLNIQMTNNNSSNSVPSEEVDNLREKLSRYKSIDAANRSSIEFYEAELEKLRLKNEKLNRRLDETLVTLNHCADLSTSTEIEYLKNVLYSYMLGKESLVMARVLAAVCKFDAKQTDAVIKHEQHKQSLLGQLGIL